MIARVILLLPPGPLKTKLHQALAQDDIVIEALPLRQSSWQRLGKEISDLVVVSLSVIPSPALESISLLCEVPDSPAVAVITGSDDAEERAQLQAAGCGVVLEEDTPAEAVVDVLLALLTQRRERVVEQLAAKPVFTQPRLGDFVSRSPVMQAFMEVVERVAHSTVSLLILGETGVGKERLARAIHNDGPRSAGPFVAINCGALPETLLESELFGHERGAFTGAARSRRGCFEVAHRGTVFLDEIGELPLHLQVKLLRVLQEREVRRLGAEKVLIVDVRIMAATNRDLEDDVAQGCFRRDLYYRLGVMSLTLPSLQDRREDIPDLVQGYIDYLRPKVGLDVDSITSNALEAMACYDWPGNVRELINVVERAMLLCNDSTITTADLPQIISQHSSPEPVVAPLLQSGNDAAFPEAWLDRPWRQVRRMVVDRMELAYLDGLLTRTRGRIGPTADLAGIQPRSLFEKMRRLGLHKEAYKQE